MPSSLFTTENSRLAAKLHGDPNQVHINDRFGKIIAPGLMQLQGFIALTGWRPGFTLDITLHKPVITPNDCRYSSISTNEYSLDNQDTYYAKARLYASDIQTYHATIIHSTRYRLTDKILTPDQIQDWKVYADIPYNLSAQIVPKTDDKTLKKISVVGVSANAFVRALEVYQGFLPDLFFPQVREQGKDALLESKIKLFMKEVHDLKVDPDIGLRVHPIKKDPENKKGLIASVSEQNNLFSLEIYFTLFPKDLLSRLLKRM